MINEELRQLLLPFVVGAGSPNVWIYANGYKIYIRRDPRRTRFWLANIEVYVVGAGTFKNTTLPTLEEVLRTANYRELIIENVGHPRFQDFFRKLGWNEVTLGGTPNFTKQL